MLPELCVPQISVVNDIAQVNCQSSNTSSSASLQGSLSALITPHPQCCKLGPPSIDTWTSRCSSTRHCISATNNCKIPSYCILSTHFDEPVMGQPFRKGTHTLHSVHWWNIYVRVLMSRESYLTPKSKTGDVWSTSSVNLDGCTASLAEVEDLCGIEVKSLGTLDLWLRKSDA